ncbi:hypothetical protein, partial [Bacillus sp. S1-R2T1-FB]|uniref:hypothetical protein n=1 Tax=Bacillus sp. S1-R2T1-FB TaxID=1973493 RepID=UPI001C501F07
CDYLYVQRVCVFKTKTVYVFCAGIGGSEMSRIDREEREQKERLGVQEVQVQQEKREEQEALG